MKGIILCERYTKGVPFPSKKVYKRVRAWTSGGASPCKTLLSAPSPPLPAVLFDHLSHLDDFSLKDCTKEVDLEASSIVWTECR